MTVTLSAAPSVMSFRLALPQDLADHFDAQAALAGTTLEEYLAEHLARTRDWVDAHPIYLNDRQAREVRKVLGGRVSSGAVLVEAIRWLVTLEVAGIAITLPPSVMEAISWAARSMGRPTKEAAPELIVAAIREKYQA